MCCMNFFCLFVGGGALFVQLSKGGLELFWGYQNFFYDLSLVKRLRFFSVIKWSKGVWSRRKKKKVNHRRQAGPRYKYDSSIIKMKKLQNCHYFLVHFILPFVGDNKEKIVCMTPTQLKLIFGVSLLQELIWYVFFITRLREPGGG